LKYFEGDHGIRFVFDDVIHTLPPGSEFYRYSSRKNTSTKNFENTMYARHRDKRKIERLVITSQAKAKLKKPKLERAIKVIPDTVDLFEDDVSLIIYGPKLAYLDYSSKTSFIIESEKIASFQKKLFKLLWKQL